MAQKEDLDLDIEGAKPPKRSGAKIFLILLALLALPAIGGGVAWFLFGGKGEDVGDGSAAVKLGPPVYVAIEPALVINFATPTRARYLQVGMELLTRDPAAVEGVRLHMPAIRNELIVYFSGKSYDDLASREGKEAAKGEVLAAVNRIIAERGVKGQVDDVFFTSFVMQ